MNAVNRTFLVATLLTIVASGTASAQSTLVPASQVCPATQPTSNMTATFASEFTKMSVLDTSQWRPTVGVHGSLTDELEAYSPSDAFTMSNGAGLRLKTEAKSTMGRPYSSGKVTTRGLFSQTYGHFEMMAKMPQANGIWPAFWLLPENGAWPPEIDILEYLYAPNGVLPVASATAANNWMGSKPSMALHFGAGNSQVSPGYNSNIKPMLTYSDWWLKPAPTGWTSAYNGYHVYAVDWRPGSLNFTIDSSLVFCVIDNASTGVRVPDGPMYMILNQAVAAGTPAAPAWAGYVAAGQQFPVDMDIAYVRVSKFNDIVPQPALPLDVNNIQLSKKNINSSANLAAKSGDNVTITGTLVVGSQDMGYLSQSYFTIRPQDATSVNGIGSNIATITVKPILLRANTTNNISVTYVIPSTLAAGTYSVGLIAKSTASPINGDGVNAPAGISIAQLALLTISP